MRVRKFDATFGPFRVRSCDAHLMQDGHHDRAEILRIDEHGRGYVVAAFRRDDDNVFQLSSVGNRIANVLPNEAQSFISAVRAGFECLSKTTHDPRAVSLVQGAIGDLAYMQASQAARDTRAEELLDALAALEKGDR